MKKLLFSLAIMASMFTISCSSEDSGSSSDGPNANKQECIEGLQEFLDGVEEYKQGANNCAELSNLAQLLVDNGCKKASFFQQYANQASCFEMPTDIQNGDEDGDGDEGGSCDAEKAAFQNALNRFLANKTAENCEDAVDLAYELMGCLNTSDVSVIISMYPNAAQLSTCF